jgi:conjugative relaxase-like TrwC/TraI family protein
VLPCRRDAAGRYWIRRSDLAAFAERRKPAIARVGFDLTLTVEKSIGVLLMLSTDEQQSRLVQAFETANDVAISYMDRSASGARRRGREVGSEGLTVASYLHGTSRSLDPHPHHHNIVANAVVDDAGEVRTLDARGLYLNAPAAAALATAAFRWESRDLGLG